MSSLKLLCAALVLSATPAAFGASALKLKPAPKDIEAANKGPAHVKAPTSENDVERDAAAVLVAPSR